ncbi:MAG TPA: fused MFS/spermidine synthase [Gemmatimonadaceae bacterium]|nr:fused MFS/spermidine synthase [Gemmatimonadaceae bacterium]
MPEPSLPSNLSGRTSDAPGSPAATDTAIRRFLPLLVLLFVVSGLCALVYEVIWFQLLENVVGSTAVSLGVLLATFMGGMCLGSLLLPRVVSSRHHPLRVYAALEAGIGVIGMLTLVLVPVAGGLYTAASGPSRGGVLLRGLICAACLLPPTMLMGATLPAVARWLTATPRGVSWIGLLYGANTVGAVLGGVLAGFYLLRAYDVTTATILAALLNGVVAATALLVAVRTPPAPAPVSSDSPDMRTTRGAWVVYIGIGLSGACALGAEVLWTRLLSLMLGGTVYTFAMILAVFLSGLGAGSTAGAWVARRTRHPRLALGWCQLLLTLGVAWAALMVARVLPYWPVDPSLSASPWFTMHLDLTRVMWMVVPAAMLWGASFPLAIAAVACPQADSGRIVGRVYAANTVGAITGSLAFSLLLIPWVGTRASHQVLVAVSAFSALAVFVSLVASRRPGERLAPTPLRGLSRAPVLASAGAAVIAGIVITLRVPDVPAMLIAYGRHVAAWDHKVDVLYVGEGMNSSIAVSRLRSSGATQLHVAGKVEASSQPQEMRLQRMLGHLPALLHGQPTSALVVGFGAGMTAGALIVHPELRRMVISEVEPLLPRVMSRYFGAESHGVLHDRRVEMVFGEARSLLLSTGEKFDVITADPIHPWVKGAASLYTKEYFETIRRHLNPGGVVSQWVPLHESGVDAVKSEIATFLSVFPNGTLWANTQNGRGFDLVLVGTLDSTRIDLEALEQRFARLDHTRVAESLGAVGFYGPLDLIATYSGHSGDLGEWLAGVELNRDRTLRLQYLAGMGANRHQSERIYDEILSHRSFPESIFRADPVRTQLLRNFLLGWR